MECVAEVPSVSEQNGHCSHSHGEAQTNGNGRADSYSFSTELIAFSLYGKIPPKCRRPWKSLSAKIAEVQESFKNIPSMLYFAPSSVSLDGVGVYAADPLPKATMLGPYFGRTVHKDQVQEYDHTEWLWEVYQDSSLAYFVDASDPRYGNWMNFIQCARNKQEQNLKALQYNGCLYFEATRDVAVGEELLVWYDEGQYDVYMGIPTGYRGKDANDSQPTGKNSFANDPTHDPSGNETNDSLAAAHGQQYANSMPNIAANLSDTNTDDSGISMSFENSGGPPPPLTPTTQQQNQVEVPQLKAVYTPRRRLSTDTVENNQDYTENIRHSYTNPKAIDSGFVESAQGAYPETPVSTWAPNSNGHTSPLTPTKQSQQQIVDMSSWPLKSVSKARSSSLLYGMFSRSEDGSRWQCEECKRLFSSQGSLRAHARIHTGERPYQCQYCFRTFCQASTLRSHERLHTGEKPYKCDHCGRTFTQSAGLRSHLKTHRYDS